MNDVISLAEFREKKLAEKSQSRDFWAAFLGPPAPPAPESMSAKVALPHNGSPEESENFDKGLRAGWAGGRYNPKSTGAAYPCGYLQGAFFREFSTDDSAWLVDWRFEHDIRKSGELFDDELAKMPRRRPKLASQRARDVLIAVDMILLTKHIKGATAIIAEIRNRYGISKATAWKLWDGPDVKFGAWLKPILRTTPNKSPGT